jgi:hypothetical protein
MSTSDFSPTTPLVYTATIVEVNPSAYTMRLYSKLKGTTMPVEIPSYFTNSRGGLGGGMHIMPEVGAEVWACETSDGTVVPISYHGVIGDKSYVNGRPDSLPGDIVLSTTHGNSIKVLKGGSILLQTSAVCSTLLDPDTDAIHTFSNSYYRYALSSKEEHICDNDGDRNTETVYSYYSNAEDTLPTAVVSYGTVPGGLSYSMSVGSSYTVEVDTSGNATESYLSLDMTSASNINITAPVTLAITTPSMSVTGAITAASIAVGSISVGAAGASIMSSSPTGAYMAFGDLNSTDTTPVIKAGTNTDGFFYDLSRSLNGLIATVAAIQAIVETLDATVTLGSIQDALDQQGLSIDAQPLVDMKVKVESFLQTNSSQYTTNKLQSE